MEPAERTRLLAQLPVRREVDNPPVSIWSSEFAVRRITLLTSLIPVGATIAVAGATASCLGDCDAQKGIIMVVGIIGCMFTSFSCMGCCMRDPPQTKVGCCTLKTSLLTKLQTGLGLATFAINAGFSIWAMTTAPKA